MRACSLWDFGCAWDGWKLANGVKDAPAAPSWDAFEAWTTGGGDGGTD